MSMSHYWLGAADFFSVNICIPKKELNIEKKCSICVLRRDIHKTQLHIVVNRRNLNTEVVKRLELILTNINLLAAAKI